MKKFIFALLATGQLFAASVITDSGGGYELNRASTLNRKYSVGTHLANGTFGVKGQWSFAVSGGAASTDIYLLDAEGLRVSLPAKSIVTNCLIDVATAPTAATTSGGATFLLKSNGESLKGLTYNASLTTTAPIACTPTGSVGQMLKIASETFPVLRTTSEAMTAGKINVWLQYVLSN